MNPTQSNTQAGKIIRIAVEDLTRKEGFLCLIEGGGQVSLAGADVEVVTHIVDAGGPAGSEVSIDPLEPGRQYRVPIIDACPPGGAVVLAGIGVNRGKVRRAANAPVGSHRVIGHSEETQETVAGQFALIRPSFNESPFVVA